MADGVVSSEEYEQGYRSFSSCMDAGGFAILEGGMYGNVYEYSFPSAAREAGVYDECYVGYFERLDEEWQIINIDLSPTTAYIKECLERFGIEPRETYDDVNRQLDENSISFGEC